MAPKLIGKVALVAGGTRGGRRGIAVELGAGGCLSILLRNIIEDNSTERRRSKSY
jgi:NAD(P)-dependent dehydrogenase (short-subunit alcohol dehydrogenase family)